MAVNQATDDGLEALQQMANSLTSCDICTDTFENPRVLPCLHTFCLACLEGHFNATNQQRIVPVSNFPCPSCRAVCYIPSKGLDKLPKDFRLDKLHDLRRVVDMVRTRSSSIDSTESPNAGSRAVSRTSSLKDESSRPARRVLMRQHQNISVDSSSDELEDCLSKSCPTTGHEKLGLILLNRSRNDVFHGELLWTCESFTCCRDCCFLFDGQVVATDYASIGRDRVKIISATGQLLQAVESVLIIKPWAVCFNEATASLFITDHADTALCVTKVEMNSTKNVSSWKCSLIRPSGIAFTPSGELVISETGEESSHALGIYAMKASGSFRLVRQLGEKGDDEEEVLRANYLAVDGNGRIVVSDCDSHHIKVFSAEGQQLLKFSACGSDGEDMVPQGVAVDGQGNIFVADQAVRGVHMFTPEGQQEGEVLRTLGTPWGISYDKKMKRLAVATDKGLEVYQVD